MPVLRAVITRGLMCRSHAAISLSHSSLERYLRRLLSSGNSLTLRTCFKVSDSTNSQSTALLNMCLITESALLIVEFRKPLFKRPVWNCSTKAVENFRKGILPSALSIRPMM
ncbi:MAG: hypothetical protein A2235_02280 [Deltaproteobacteria bacterium RIFOXYA2_FULL_42_10]|nr:MAG: hypothetical protein A2090_01080 [Deltaproteobacteria bacterium GWD2_42_10]OGQ74335.1 MAG: hypothetical protein A2235_02280 [Deltaproteobacteria bacterium RIFOXYA2_FULL_42_10]